MVAVQIRMTEDLNSRCHKLMKKMGIKTFSKFGSLVCEWACENNEGKKK
jgi:hypothetical protein